MSSSDPYWYLASDPKSGNTWCRVFITELRRLAGLDRAEATAAAEQKEQERRLNRALATGSIVSSRHWRDDQLGIDSSDLCWAEQDKLRGRVRHQRTLYSECLRDHKVHDAFVSPDSAGRPAVPVECRCWRLWVTPKISLWGPVDTHGKPYYDRNEITVFSAPS